jgi:hypothetical protein
MSNREAMTKRRNRLRRIAKWLGTALAGIIIAAWFLTIPLLSGQRLRFIYHRRANFWCFERGALEWTHLAEPQSSMPGWTVQRLSSRHSSYTYGIRLPSRQHFSSGFKSYALPLWLPLAFIGLPTALLWYLDRRPRVPPGQCPSCNYNLSGNTSGICPECGTPCQQ